MAENIKRAGLEKEAGRLGLPASGDFGALRLSCQTVLRYGCRILVAHELPESFVGCRCFCGAVYFPTGICASGDAIYRIEAVSPQGFEDDGHAIAWGMSWERANTAGVQKLAAGISAAAASGCADKLVAKEGAHYLGVVNGARLRGVLLGNPDSGGYAYLWADRRLGDGGWESGQQGFPPTEEIAERILAACECRPTPGMLHRPAPGESDADLALEIATVMRALAAKAGKAI